jgi:hypothetical protein
LWFKFIMRTSYRFNSQKMFLFRPEKYFVLLFLASFFSSTEAQVSASAEIIFDFNAHSFNEKNNKLKANAVGVTLVDDRFGNEKSAVYLHGYNFSYLTLGTSPLLKPKHGTISLWVNLTRRVYSGKGYDHNPIIVTKNGPQPDWNCAYAIGYESNNNRFGTTSSIDSLKEVIVHSDEKVEFDRWYHLAISFDEEYFSFYQDGKLRGKFKKGFETVYYEKDSVVVGHSASKKNERFAQGVFDDIMIFHRVLNETEIAELYAAPNPNRFRNFINEFVKYAVALLLVLAIIAGIIFNYRRKLKRQKAQYELNSRISELEMKVLKAQMNPHFISNCLSAIQELIYNREIEKAGQYLARFSFFLRQILDYSDKTYISLNEEIEIINLSIELEQLRFKDNFDFELNLSKDINGDALQIPSLISQPFIENAIWHGLLPLKGKRRPRLRINIFSGLNNVVMEIADNGAGRKNQEKKPGRNSRGTKLAADKLENINKLTRSSDYKLEIIDLMDENGSAAGTKVIIQLANNID